MSAGQTQKHDPAETKDYLFDFRALTNQNRSDAEGDLLESGETIATIDDITATRLSGEDTPAFTVGTPASALANTNSAVRFWGTGGALNAVYEVECIVTTSAGRTYNRRMLINITDL